MGRRHYADRDGSHRRMGAVMSSSYNQAREELDQAIVSLGEAIARLNKTLVKLSAIVTPEDRSWILDEAGNLEALMMAREIT